MPTVGETLPTLFFERSQDAEKSIPHRRKCEKCGLVWRTIEFAMAERWSGGRPSRCFKAQWHGGRVHKTIEPNEYAELEAANKITQGVFTALRHGAVYRRRKCLRGCRDWKGRRLGWSTMEVLASGIICGDVTECARCGGWGKKQIVGVPSNRHPGKRRPDLEELW